MSAKPSQITLDRIRLETLNIMNRESFIQRLGHVFERSSWVAERSWERRPFVSLDELHRIMVEVVRKAGRERQLAIIRAHPELGVAAGCPDTLTPSSRDEQASAGLPALDGEVLGRLHLLNTKYRQRFGFPFVMAVRRRTHAEILASIEERLGNGLEVEFERALSEISCIARFRLEAIVEV